MEEMLKGYVTEMSVATPNKKRLTFIGELHLLCFGKYVGTEDASWSLIRSSMLDCAPKFARVTANMAAKLNLFYANRLAKVFYVILIGPCGEHPSWDSIKHEARPQEEETVFSSSESQVTSFVDTVFHD